MKTVTPKNIKWSPDNTFFTPAQTLKYYGQARNIKIIVIHWWNEPSKAGTIDDTVNYLKRAEESIHFVVSGDRIVQMVNMNNTAFHAGSKGNPISVGIEVDPKLRGNTYETTGALVKFIRTTLKRNLPLKPHSAYVATKCPGSVSLNKIESAAKGHSVKATPKKPDTKSYWRVYKGSKQVAAYSTEKNAWEGYLEHKATKITNPSKKDVTAPLRAKYLPKPTPSPIKQPQVAEPTLEARVSAIEKLIAKIKKFIEDIFNIKL